MRKIPYHYSKIPNVVLENRRLSPSAKLTFVYLLERESLLVSLGECSSGGWFPASYEAMASPLGVKAQSVGRNYVPQLVEAGLIETKTEQGFDRKQWIPKKTCMYRILWDNILNNQ